MDDTPLTPACSDAELLVTYLMREGITIKPETLAAIEQGQAADSTHPLAADAKTNFLWLTASLPNWQRPLARKA